MDQAMGDLQTQLEELKKAWEQENHQKQRLEMELQALKGQQAAGGIPAPAANGVPPTQHKSPSPKGEKRSVDGDDREDKDGKRQRTE
jgi:transcriptional regulator CBF1